MDSSAFNRRMPPDFEVVLLVITIAGVLTISMFFIFKEPSAISLPTKDFVCTESAIVNGVAECVKYERRNKP